MEGSPSGLWHTLGKRAGAIPREFESHTLRKVGQLDNIVL